MRSFRTTLLGGIAALALAGFVGTAAAQSGNTHVMQIRLPGGGIGEIHYAGDVPPRVVFTAEPTSLAAFDPFPSFFGSDSPFAAMQRISADMDCQISAMLARAETVVARTGSGSPQAIEAALGSLPGGSAGYSYVSTMSSNGVCTHSVQVTSQGNGAPPKVVSHSSGDCGPDAGSAPEGSVNLPVAQPPADNKRPDLILTKTNTRKGYAGMVRHVADRSR